MNFGIKIGMCVFFVGRWANNKTDFCDLVELAKLSSNCDFYAQQISNFKINCTLYNIQYLLLLPRFRKSETYCNEINLQNLLKTYHYIVIIVF